MNSSKRSVRFSSSASKKQQGGPGDFCEKLGFKGFIAAPDERQTQELTKLAGDLGIGRLRS